MSASSQSSSFPRISRSLYPEGGEEGLLVSLLKSENLAEESRSNQSTGLGLKDLPFDMDVVNRIMTYNPHHSACIYAKANSTVGLGHVTEQKKQERKAKAAGEPPPANEVLELLSKADKVLNPLCVRTWQETQLDVAMDFWSTGSAYLEVIRRGDKIVGIHHLPTAETRIFVEDRRKNFHYVISGSDGFSSDGSTERRFAQFGDKEGFLARQAKGEAFPSSQGTLGVNPDDTSEVIQFRLPTQLSKWYGFPDWIAAVADIELIQLITQHNFDFFLNRGIPEMMLFAIGSMLPKKTWEDIESMLKAHVGMGNSHKSMAVNIGEVGEDFKIQLEKLGIDDSNDDKFSSMRDNITASIVSGHRVPPLMAGIQIPGKLGATNELPNAMQLFQALSISPVQKLFQQTYGQTLVLEDSIDLTAEDFEYVKITEEIDVAGMDTVARMRQSPAQANAEGRDMDKGVKE